MAEPPVPPYSTRDWQAEPTVLGKRLVGFARRARLVIAALGVIRRADVVEQFLDMRP